MKILVVAATKAELTLLYQHFSLPETDFVETKDFDILITGVGMVATAFALGKHLNQQYNLILNIGIAGCFDRKLELGDLVNITQDTFSELGAESGDEFLTINNLGFGESVYYAKSGLKLNLRKVNAITVNRITGNKDSMQSLVDRLNPTTESMEGAAVFYACKQENKDCLQVRSISNYVGPRNKENWEMSLAIKKLNDWVISFLLDMSRL